MKIALPPFVVAGFVVALCGQEPTAGPLRTHFVEIHRGAAIGPAPLATIPLEIADQDAESSAAATLAVPDGAPKLRLTRYLPSAMMFQDCIQATGPDAKPALQLLIAGPKQQHRPWLLAGDPKRERLISLIGRWSIVAVKDPAERDALFAAYGQSTAKPARVIARLRNVDGSFEMPATGNATVTVGDGGPVLKVLRYFPHFSMGDAHQPSNLSDKPVNPAVQVAITRDGKTIEQWFFARMPEFSRDPADPLEVTLDAPVESDGRTAEYCFALAADGHLELWTRTAAGVASEPLEPGRKIAIPNSKYTFQVDRAIPSGRLVEHWGPSDGRAGSIPVVQVETPAADGAMVPVWLPVGDPQTITTKDGPFTLVFQRRLPTLPAGHPTGH